MKKKTVCISICILLIIAVLPTSGTIVEKSSISSFDGNTLYVGGNGTGNYTKIQDAIDDASDGDTVFVYDDSSPYYENLEVDKSIHIIGEDKNSTVIDGNMIGDVVYISADWVNVNGFKIRNGGLGIRLRSNCNTITGNNISNNEDGLILWDSSDNTISGNTITSNNNFGIYLRYSSNRNTITSNTINSNSDYGIGLHISDNNTITSNNIISNNNDGIYLYYSSDNTISGNTITSNNNFGIYLRYSSNRNTITVNTISNNGYDGIYLYYSSDTNITGNSFFNDGLRVYYSYHSTVDNNTVNGKPLVYLEDESDKVIDYEVGQLLLVNCDNITVENLTLSNVDVGMELWDTDNSKIRDNYFSNNGGGIFLYESSMNTISSNNDGGITLRDSNENTIRSNNDCRIKLEDGSNRNTITMNTISNRNFGISIDSSKNNTITDNNTSNNGDGISLDEYSSGNTIMDNNISNNENGICLHYSNNNTITNNNIISNNNDGIYLDFSSNNNNISGNIVSSNKWYGIELTGYSGQNNYNIITGNNIISNHMGGLYVNFNCYNNTITKNNIQNNKEFGLHLYYSGYFVIEKNNIHNNERVGLEIVGFSHNNVIEKNNFIGNGINVIHSLSSGNTWDANYWDNWIGVKIKLPIFQKFPKVIFGGFPSFINFDWHPASEPYNIGV